MMAITIVMGLPGAGKSTVLAALKGKQGVSLVNWGDLQFEIAQKQKLVSHRDELRKLSPDMQKKIQEEVGKALSKMEGGIVLDTHCSIATPKGYLPGLPLAILSQLPVRQLVLITAPVGEIIARRNSDPTRVRDAQTTESLSEHDSMNKYLLAAYAMASGAPAKIIVNAQGRLETAQRELLSSME